MNKKYNISAIGECLIDCVPVGENELGCPVFSANPGGAPANVLAMYSKLGGRSAFIGKVGDDNFGRQLYTNLKNAGISTDGLVLDKNYNTTLAFVHLDSAGDRSFSFYRKPGADIMLTPDEVPSDIIRESEIFHFGSVSLTDEPVRSATIEAVKTAKASGALISYDPNFRPLLWQNRNEAIEQMRIGANLADIIKVSDEELELITGENDYSRGAHKLCNMGISLVFVTLGSKGAFYYTEKASGILKTYNVRTVDTTGAGDTFFGSALWKLSGKTTEQIANLTNAELEDIVRFANAAGSLTTTKKGAIFAMPLYDDIIALMNKESV